MIVGLSKRQFLVLILILFFILPALTAACGGFFCSNTPIDQNAERIIFAVDRSTQTITAVVGINYTGEAKDFSWVVPIPSVPKLDVAETASLDLLQAGTNKQLVAPPDYCEGLVYGEFGGSGFDDSSYTEQGSIGPYDYAVIRNANPGELVQWLRDNGYRVTDDMIPIIRHYVDDGMFFLAMKLSQDATVGDIQPVVMTYKDENPMIPIRLTAVAAVPDMPVITWIFADTQYVPKNYAHPTPDYASFHDSSQINNYFGGGPVSVYAAEQKRIQDEYGGQAFVTDFAGASSDLRPAIQDDPLLSKLIAQYPYVTRLRAQMSPEQMTLDPIFIPDASAPDVPLTVDLSGYVDPLQYWGCGSRTIRDPQAEALLPEYTHIDELNFRVGYPQGWVMSQFTYDDQPVWAFASKPVAASDIDAFKAGKETVPILLINDNPYESDYSPRVRARLKFYGEGGNDYSLSRIIYAMLVTSQQWNENEKLYTAMLDYPNTFQYYADPELRYTLFLTLGGDGQSRNGAYVGYPDGWIEKWVDNAAAVMPEDAGSNPPIVRLISIEQLAPGAPPASLDDLHAIGRRYGLTDQQQQIFDQGLRDCTADPLPFSKDGRQGYVTFCYSYVIEASASEADFPSYDAVLQQIMKSVNYPSY